MALYTYRAEVEDYPAGVHDGDTFHAVLDLGFGLGYRVAIRLARINAPELHDAGGAEARDFLRSILDGPIVVSTSKPDKYGRVLGEVALADGRNVSDEMVAAGKAKPWDGRGVKP